ncbi:MAG: HoxN/HupN/NixA family nickel/cobalt transporter [Thermoplasmata archaeon]|nr:HoxN/HupN/NixA family nickel/cobalt transporter [Thermoplasmata archaeon]
MGLPARASPASDPLALTRQEKASMSLLYGGIGLATLLGFVGAFLYLPHGVPGVAAGGGLVFTGLAITAYILGLRHGFDADHIAAIDNTTRKLLGEGQRPLTVGTWFSLGHSTIVCAMVAAFVVAADFADAHIAALRSVGTLFGLLVSGFFLVVIGLVNLVLVAEVYRLFRDVRTRKLDPADLDREMELKGFLYRYFGRLFRVIRSPKQIYPVGILFGLGFDTTTEVLLIASAVGFALTPVPFWAVMFLPLLFTCGMVLSDTTDGFAMRYAYGWAFRHPVRKLYYNLTLTIISVLVAFAIGGVEMLQVLSLETGWSGPPWSGLDHLDFGTLGIAIAALFVGAWLVAMAIYRFKGFERSAGSPASGVPVDPAGSGGLGSRSPP